MNRPDLLALTPDVLAALANRGLVKRATKDLDAGVTPTLEVADDGTLRGRFSDGTDVALPAGAGLDAASCGCGAPGFCRHRIGLVLAYQRQCGDRRSAGAAGVAPAAFTRWTPGSIDDDTMTGLFGARTLAAARRVHRAGYLARIHRPTAEDPIARVDLPTCTVRFLVPGEPGHIHTDAAPSTRGEVVVLAVWAFRQADERDPAGDDIYLDVGGGRHDPARLSGVEPALDLVNELLLGGAMHASPVMATALRRAGRSLAERDLHWPAAVVDDIAGQLSAHRARGAGYRAERFAELLTELHARHRAAVNSGAGPRSRLLGSDESARTPLRRVRLTSLGCLIGGTAEERTADVFLAHAESGTVLVLRRRWETRDGRAATGHELAARRVNGSSLGALATANIVSESASRGASRVVRLTSNRVAGTTITPLGRAAWSALPASMVVRDFDALARATDALPPRLVRPRVEAEHVRVIAIEQVCGLGYDPADQRLDATIADAAGATATVSAVYSALSPGALDCLADTLSGAHGRPLFVSGVVRRTRSGIVVSPIAVMTDSTVIVPDLAGGDGDGALAAPTAPVPDPLGVALDGALAVCAEASHRGLRHLSPGFRSRVEHAASDLDRVGLHTAAGLLVAFRAALGAEDTELMVRTWVNVQLRLVTSAEFR